MEDAVSTEENVTKAAVLTDRARRVHDALNSYRTPHEQLHQLREEFERTT